MNKKMYITLLVILTMSFIACNNNAADFRIAPLGNGTAEIIDYVGTNQTVRIPSRIQRMTITGIGDEAFRNKQIISVTIPNTVTEIGHRAFEGNMLTSLTIPESVRHLGFDAFARNRLTSVTIGPGWNFRDDFRLIGSGFEDAMRRSGGRAGTYTRLDTNSTNWTRR